jgi:cell division septation protein DedD
VIFSLVALGSFVEFEGEIVGALVLVVIGVVFLAKALSRGESGGPPGRAASV